MGAQLSYERHANHKEMSIALFLLYLGFTFPHYITTMHKNNIRIESPDENKIKKAIEFLKLHL